MNIRFLRHRLAALTIVTPLFAWAVYLFGFAADRYVSESTFSVKQENDSGANFSGLTALLPIGAAGSNDDAQMLMAYLQSVDALQALDKRVNLRSLYAKASRDFIFRLPDDAVSDDFLTYYRHRIDIYFDETSRLITLTTQGFAPEDALVINRTLIELGEQFLNNVSSTLASEQMKFAEQELVRAQKTVEERRTALLKYQTDNNMLDPNAQAVANSSLTLELQATLARQQSELKTLLSYLSGSSYQVRALQQQIEATRRQIDEESRRGTGQHGGALNRVAAEYQHLTADFEFAERAYSASLLAVQAARIESSRKVKSLVLVASPVAAALPAYPRRIYDLILLLIFASVVYGILRVTLAVIHDHEDQ